MVEKAGGDVEKVGEGLRKVGEVGGLEEVEGEEGEAPETTWEGRGLSTNC